MRTMYAGPLKPDGGFQTNPAVLSPSPTPNELGKGRRPKIPWTVGSSPILRGSLVATLKVAIQRFCPGAVQSGTTGFPVLGSTKAGALPLMVFPLITSGLVESGMK